jgi:hypothetical protein
MAYFTDRIADAFRALTKWTKGDTLTDNAEQDIAWLERTLELKKPLRSYSKRSQRRFKQRLQEGATSSRDVYSREYKQRKTAVEEAREEHGLTPTQWRRVEPLRNRIIAMGVDADPYMDDDVLKDFAELYGYEYLRRVLTEQIDSTEHYLRGDTGPGNQRWNARGSLEAQFGASRFVSHIRGSDPYYYYHGRKS